MPSYKLHYFNARGFAEISRLLFAAAGVEYDDIRYDRVSWPEAKTHMPYGVVPVLEVDGERICQSFAIAKYLARTFGFNGSNSMEEAKIDEMIEHTRDMMKDFMGVHFEKDEDKKNELLKEMQEVILPKHFEIFEKALCKNKGGDGFCVGDKLSIADIQLFHVLGWVSEQKEVLATFSKCLAFFGRIKEIPRIKEWLEKRPVTTI
ncbi:S-crystallin SL11-like [Lineus longissimus]|uniref:S-crystallin SL11-like n=1 Tax=Lineus longissimus TaxID=88925 RepID=UPI00315D3CB4